MPYAPTNAGARDSGRLPDAPTKPMLDASEAVLPVGLRVHAQRDAACRAKVPHSEQVPLDGAAGGCYDLQLAVRFVVSVVR